MWNFLRSKLKKDSKTPKFHDSQHKIDRIKLYGPTNITSTRSFEKEHHSSIKLAYVQTNKKDVSKQLVDKVTLLNRYSLNL
jgi:DNA-binding MltR family transcriptional regulator